MQNAHHKVKIYVTVILALLAIAGCATLSTAAPTTTLTISEPKFGTSTEYVNILTEFSLSASPISTIWYHWDSYDYIEYTGPFKALVEMQSVGGVPGLPIDLEDGLHTLHYNSTDSTGQSEVPKSKSIIVDNTIPITSIQLTGTHYTGTSEFIKSDTQINLTSSDTGSGVASISYKIDSGQYVDYHAPFTVTESGQHTIAYHATDNVDNKEPDKTMTVFVDSNAPSVEIALGYPNIVATGTIYVHSTTSISLSMQDDSGIAESSYRIDAGTWTNYITSFTVATEGRHTIAGRATDNLGISSVETTLTINVDNTPPVVSINGSSDTIIEVKKGEKIEFECYDSGAESCTIYYSLNEGTFWTEYVEPIIMNQDTTVRYYAEDGLGNSAVETTVYVKITSSGINAYLIILWIVVITAILIIIYLTYKKVHEEPGKEEKIEKQKPKDEEAKPKKRKIKRNN